ncbi:FAD-dependent monooxygenase [Amycolatopsis sp. NPDC059657]|uniref:FAD-dependent monooxygenase n=1 Tax=Amycolatopsis sp. NPDC059657 TaxID=3346899 RepID=UPI0036721F2C
MAKNMNVLVSGASIAGPALAYWLHHYGFSATVVEQAPEIRDGGYAVDLRGTAVEVTKRMGLFDTIKEQGTGVDGISYVDINNKVKGSLGKDFLGGSGVVAEVEILHGDLSRILYDATKDYTEYVFGDSITSITETADGVEVTFERGAPRTFDYVFGADGLHSNVRALTFGDESRFIHHLGYYMAIFTTENHLNLDHWECFYNMPGKAAGMQSARGNSEAMAMFHWSSDPLFYDRHDIEQQKKILLDVFSGEGWEIPRLLKALPDAPDFFFDSIAQVKMNDWAKGRIALVGDAAHSSSVLSGMATSMALVGAYIVVGELQAHLDDHGTAFKNYREDMREYVELNHKIGAGNATGLMPKTNFAIWRRNFLVRMMPYIPGKEKFLGAYEKAANAAVLKDY